MKLLFQQNHRPNTRFVFRETPMEKKDVVYDHLPEIIQTKALEQIMNHLSEAYPNLSKDEKESIKKITETVIHKSFILPDTITVSDISTITQSIVKSFEMMQQQSGNQEALKHKAKVDITSYPEGQDLTQLYIGNDTASLKWAKENGYSFYRINCANKDEIEAKLVIEWDPKNISQNIRNENPSIEKKQSFTHIIPSNIIECWPIVIKGLNAGIITLDGDGHYAIRGPEGQVTFNAYQDGKLTAKQRGSDFTQDIALENRIVDEKNNAVIQKKIPLNDPEINTEDPKIAQKKRWEIENQKLPQQVSNVVERIITTDEDNPKQNSDDFVTEGEKTTTQELADNNHKKENVVPENINTNNNESNTQETPPPNISVPDPIYLSEYIQKNSSSIKANHADKFVLIEFDPKDQESEMYIDKVISQIPENKYREQAGVKKIILKTNTQVSKLKEIQFMPEVGDTQIFDFEKQSWNDQEGYFSQQKTTKGANSRKEENNNPPNFQQQNKESRQAA